MTKRKSEKVAPKPDALPKLYKVLVGGKSCHGGSFEWDLPKKGKPGKWHEIAAGVALVLCSSGFHLTDADGLPHWWEDGAKVYEVEVDGESVGDVAKEKDRKVCARRVRIVREVDEVITENGCLVSSGVHEIKSGWAIASGSSTVRASGSSTVTASGSSTVTASGSSTVRASGRCVVASHKCPWTYSPKVTVTERAAWIDQRGDKPRVELASVSP
jgi:hypothetical protein